MTTLGKEIRKARIDRGWKQKDLQEAIGLSQKHLSQIENDAAEPKASVIKRIAEALNISADTLLDVQLEEAMTAPR